MVVSIKTFEQLALDEPAEKWELLDGRVRKKPPMTMEHSDLAFELAFTIRSQVAHDQFHVRCDQGRLLSGASYLVPDVFVVEASEALQFRGLDATLEAYSAPVPFVAEVWSRSTGQYDLLEKLEAYRLRGDHEIWLLHPYEKWVRINRKAADGSYSQREVAQGLIPLAALPGVTIDVGSLLGR
ncbi:MAG: Uma2 family endonuclease [Tepidiformaceae bacterium]